MGREVTETRLRPEMYGIEFSWFVDRLTPR